MSTFRGQCQSSDTSADSGRRSFDMSSEQSNDRHSDIKIGRQTPLPRVHQGKTTMASNSTPNNKHVLVSNGYLPSEAWSPQPRASPSPAHAHAHQKCLTPNDSWQSYRMSTPSPLPLKQPILDYRHHTTYELYNIESQMNHIQTRLNHADLQDTENLFLNAGKGSKYRPVRPSPFDLITDDVIVKVMSHLSTDQLCRCSRVSQRWYRLVWDPTLWKTIAINSDKCNVDKALRYLTKRLSYNTPTVCIIVERIVLGGCEKLTDRGLQVIAKRCPELRHLELQGCTRVTNSALFEIASYCVNMEYLDVTGTYCVKVEMPRKHISLHIETCFTDMVCTRYNVLSTYCLMLYLSV
jgi:hypothetical protein